MTSNKLILIDNPDRNGWCHMVSSNLGDLHEFAKLIGLSRRWFHNKPYRPHYDVRDGMITKALNAGAKRVSRKELLMFLKENYE
ncbi:MAG: DUF4031 domain-containing protein [Leptospiraceae bacterium]|nr:DUF4031 domain-containing protein [Leptospiraceae bacterium]